uniref:Uncharacterized protein n=1 Tax=Oryza barthii TaxID=65489 RepID=A0A0D3F1U5_9ORYZ
MAKQSRIMSIMESGLGSGQSRRFRKSAGIGLRLRFPLWWYWFYYHPSFFLGKKMTRHNKTTRTKSHNFRH